MKWAKSLVRLATHEVEGLQRRLAEVVERRMAVERDIASLDAEVQSEIDNADLYESSGLYLAGFREGARRRREALESRLSEVAAEEAGARDALSEAFENQKKYEQVVETADLAEKREQARRETAVLDELGQRRRQG